MTNAQQIKTELKILEQRTRSQEGVMRFMINVQVKELAQAEQMRKLSLELARSMKVTPYVADVFTIPTAIGNEFIRAAARLPRFSKAHKKAIAWAEQLKGRPAGLTKRQRPR